jgi:enoyl-CoA hydratase/carnithine racemase
MSGVRIETKGAVAVLRLDKARGNAIDEPLAEELVRSVAEIAADASIRGVLLASGHPKLFCPGFDLVALYEYDRMGMQQFLTKFGDAVLSLFALRKPVVAAVAGHAVAGGCVLALTGDHRILRRGSQIGLNEVRVGISLPWSVAILLKSAVPPAALSRVALLGQNFKDEEALGVGLAHEVQESEGFESVCLARLQEFTDRDPSALGTTKAYLRDAALREMRSQEAARQGEFLDAWFAPAARAKIKETVDGLAQKG